MPVVIRTFSGREYMLDRRYTADEVARIVHEARGSVNTLICFGDNRTPSRSIYVEALQVEGIWHDGYTH